MFPNLFNTFFTSLITPTSSDENTARRELIFNILILSFSLLTLSAFLISVFRYFTNTIDGGTSPIVILLPLVIFISLFAASRIKFSNYISYFFLLSCLVLGTYSLFVYGFILPQGLLVYSLAIIMAGILLSSRASFFILLIILSILSSIAISQINNWIIPDLEGISDPISFTNLLVYIFIFGVLFSVTWLYSRDLEKSLARALLSEKLLQNEQRLLEVKVKQRTQELEKLQIEKHTELYKFAEFGRLSSSLIHDLANPLTAVSLNIDALSNSTDSKIINEVKCGILHIEQYVKSAQLELQKQSITKEFDVNYEIARVCTILKTKEKKENVHIKTNLSKTNKKMIGDNSKLRQVISNLISNGIESYSNSKADTKRQVLVSTSYSIASNTVKIVVRDFGSGIKKQDICKIYKPFYTTKSSKNGTGIGLTITKEIIENEFNGKIKVNILKPGTKFTVLLPMYSTSVDESKLDLVA